MIELLGIGRHDRLRTLLSSYVDGQVSSAETARVESHLSGCEECQRDLDNIRATVGFLRAMPDLQPSRSFYLNAVLEPVRRSWAVQWGGAVATAAAAAVFITLIAGDMTGLFEQTGLDVRNEAASDESTAVQAEMAVASDTSAASPMAAFALAEPETESVAAPQVASLSAQDEGSDESAFDAEAPTSAGVTAMAAPAPAVSMRAEPVEESAAKMQTDTESERQDEPMEGADLMPYAGSETSVVDLSIDVKKVLSESSIELLKTSDTSVDPPAPEVASSDGDDVSAPDDAAAPQQLEFASDAGIAVIAEVSDEDSTSIAMPLRQLQIAAGAMLAVIVAATLGILLRRRRTF